MNKSSLLITAASFFGVFMLSGCQNEGANLTGPDQTVGNPTPVMIELGVDQDLARGLSNRAEVSRARGGRVEVSFAKKELSVYMSLDFEPESVTNDFTASLSTDTKYLTTDMMLEFGPHGTAFLKPAKFSMDVSGLDLSKFKVYDKDNDKKVELNLYYTSNGKWEKMKGSVTLDLAKGTLKCDRAELPHFSRYAFGL